MGSFGIGHKLDSLDEDNEPDDDEEDEEPLQFFFENLEHQCWLIALQLFFPIWFSRNTLYFERLKELHVEVVEFESFRARPNYKTYQGLGSGKFEILFSS